MRKIFLTFCIILLASCETTPKIVAVKQKDDKRMSCNQLYNSIQEAKYHKRQAEKQEGFKIGYLFPINAMVTIYSLHKVKANADARIERLEKIAMQNGCFNNRSREAFYN